MEEERPFLLSIAGFDPSGGAGILADIKTFENNKVYGLGVCSALTFQNDQEFEGVKWVEKEEILRQAEVLLKRFPVAWVKIGLIENFDVLQEIVTYLKNHNPDVKIIWDPILRASAGFAFHKDIDTDALHEICSNLLLITPNLEEMSKMIPDKSPEDGARALSQYSAVLLKGGHRSDNKATDILFVNGEETRFEHDKLNASKHGTGCVLSSAILTNLAKGYDLEDACKEGKEYVTDFLKSHNSLLGYHYV
jgi:hydroxymethylpyrimidine/phosphomethylpyrimidine kinase